MPYHDIHELPGEVQNELPPPAQEIYRRAYNHAWRDYEGLGDGLSRLPRATVADKVGWWAVLLKYEYDEETDQWQVKKRHAMEVFK